MHDLGGVGNKTKVHYFRNPEEAASWLHEITKPNSGDDNGAQGTVKRRDDSRKSKTVPTGYLPDLVDIVSLSGRLAFLLKDGNTEESVEEGDRILVPSRDYEKLFGPALESEEVLTTRVDPARLLREIQGFIEEHVELPPELPSLVLALHIMQSYLWHKMEVLPYLFFSGPYGSGKSRVLEVVAALAFRGLHTAGLTPAALYRTCEAWAPTLLIDEFDRRAANDDLTVILNARYRRGLAVVRCRPKTFNTETFQVFGPTAIAGFNIPRGLVTRSLMAVMAKNTRPLPRRVDKNTARRLRAKLLAFRMHHFDAALPEAPPLTSGRLDELVSSLYAVLLLVDSEREAEFREAISPQVRRHQADENVGVEAELAEALADLQPDEEGRIAVVDIVEKLGWNPEDRKDVTRAGNLLSRSIGLEPVRYRRGSRQVRGYLWDEAKIKKFIRRYKYLSPQEGVTVAQNDLFSHLNGGVTPLCQPDFGDGTEPPKVAQGCATFEGVPPMKKKVAQRKTSSEQEKRNGCATVPPVTPTLDKKVTPSLQDASNPQGKVESFVDDGPEVLVKKPHRVELRPTCKTLVCELAGNILPWRYVFSDRTLKEVRDKVALPGDMRIIMVSGDDCWEAPYSALDEADIGPTGTIIPEAFWSKLGAATWTPSPTSNGK